MSNNIIQLNQELIHRGFTHVQQYYTVESRINPQ